MPRMVYPVESVISTVIPLYGHMMERRVERGSTGVALRGTATSVFRRPGRSHCVRHNESGLLRNAGRACASGWYDEFLLF